ncbi:MAG: prolipoprotein diacylglyceryl transferase [Bacteroidetes bacterium]|nr:prolipoprotein diacylglyceryl transferase [Bacteroidota bacterium]
MQPILTYITWNASPDIVQLGPLTLRWYGLLFALGFVFGFFIVKRMFKEEKAPDEWLDSAFIYIVIGAVVGARLGHVFFYEWDYYSQNMGEILKIWRGGLASHGGAIGVIFALWLYSKVVTKKSILWILDKVAVAVALAGCFIRLGNLMNSEIIGIATEVPWAFIFTQVDQVPRHPVQLYESISYLLLFFILFPVYWKTNARKKSGFVFGLFLVLLWSIRFFLEFFKRSQGGFETYFGDALSTGQWLSIPFILVGLYFVFRKKKPFRSKRKPAK